jgi:hypothetical protein
LSLALRDEHRMKIFEKQDVEEEVGDNCIMKSFITCTLRQM